MQGTLVFLAATALLPPVLRADHQDFVTVNATASKGYTQRKFAHGVPQRQTYVIFEGKFFGETRDPSLQRLSLMDIARVLAPDLAKQNYFPTKDARAADLLIVVNWGTTLTDPTQDNTDTERQFQFSDKMQAIQDYNAVINAGGMADPSPITFQMMINRNDQLSALFAASSNARLLGYTDILNKEEAHSWAFQDRLSTKAETYLAHLNQERYFVVLLAYDYQEMQRNHRSVGAAALLASAQSGSSFASAATTSLHKPEAPPAPVWSVRMNIRANGNNFTQALPAMSAVAADYFGKQLDDLATAHVSVGKNAHVDVGETKVLNVVK